MKEQEFKYLSKFQIMLKNKEARKVFGWFSVIETWPIGQMEKAKPVFDDDDDSHDMIPEEVLEDAGYDFVLNARVQGDMHKRKNDGSVVGVGRLIEHIVITKEKQKIWGVDFGKSGIWGGFLVDDDEVLDQIEKGNYPSFSIGGFCVREPVEKGDD